MSEHNTNSTPKGNNGIAQGETHYHPDCAGCGETSHILLPLADLLKAVASTLQAHPSHPIAAPPFAPGSDSAISEGAPQSPAGQFGRGAFNQVFRSVFDRHASTADQAQRSAKDGNGTKSNGDPHPLFPGVPTFFAGPSAQGADTKPTAAAAASDRAEAQPQTVADSAPVQASPPATTDAEPAARADSSSPVGAQLDYGEEDTESADQEQPADSRKVPLPIQFFGHKQKNKKARPNHQKPSGWDDDEEEVEEPPKQRFKNWHGIDGVAVMLFGVVFPALVMLGGCASVPKRMTLIMLNHPVETISELALLLLVPLTNYALWSALRRDDVRLALKRGISLGSAMVTSLIVCGVTFAALMQNNSQLMETEIGTTFESGFTWLAALSFMAGCATAYIMYRHLKARDFSQSRKLVMAYTAIGALLSALTLVGAEAKSWYVRWSERMAVSNQPKERAGGLAQLRWFYPERDLRMECTDSRAAGLCGMFFPMKSQAQQELYFRLTGKPFSYHDQNNDLTNMPDDYVSRNAVGDMVSGLSMVRSEMSGAVNPKTLTTVIDWTFVYRNESYGTQEARSEICMPPGAVVTGLTEWMNGEQVHGTFTATGKAQQNSKYDANGSPAAIVDLGHSRALLRCSSVPPDAEMKVAMRMIVPLQPDDLKSASLVLPKLMATNFSLADDNKVKIYSPLKLASGFSDLHVAGGDGGIKLLTGDLTGKRLQSAEVMVSVARPDAKSETPISVLDKVAVQIAQEDQKRLAELRRRSHGVYTPLPEQLTVIVDGRQGIRTQLDALSSQLNQHRDSHGLRPRVKAVKPQYVVQSVTKVKSPAPKQLVVVVDGSETMKAHAAELKKALSSVPREFPVKMLIASQDNPKLSREVPLSQGLANLDPANFTGGQNNLKSVIDATEDAGTVKGSAILWIHGPQPVLNSEIYITTPYAARPALYELPVESGEIDTSQFFKNHNDIGSFIQVSHNKSLEKDIACFFAKWEPNSADYATALSNGEQKPQAAQEISEAEGREVLQLNAYRKAMDFLAHHKPLSAARIAVAYGIVTPVSCVLVETEQQARQPENKHQDAFQEQQAAEAPALQGASNGTIGLQGADATYITGLNTAGTVRVNNLANLEALLNLIANGCEIGALITGLIIGISGFTKDRNGVYMETGRLVRRLAIGVAIISLGLSVPGCINWLVASARDANLFS